MTTCELGSMVIMLHMAVEDHTMAAEDHAMATEDHATAVLAYSQRHYVSPPAYWWR